MFELGLANLLTLVTTPSFSLGQGTTTEESVPDPAYGRFTLGEMQALWRQLVDQDYASGQPAEDIPRLLLRAAQVSLQDARSELLFAEPPVVIRIDPDLTFDADSEFAAAVTEERFTSSLFVEAFAASLRVMLGNRPMFGAAVWTESDSREEGAEAFAALAQFAQEQRSIEDGALVLWPPISLPRDQPVGLCSPTPPWRDFLSRPDLWPAAVLWEPGGASSVIPLGDLGAALGKVQGAVAIKAQDEVRETLTYLEPPKAPPSIQLLHLSDLHAGSDEAESNEGRLLAELKALDGPKPDYLVLTGDIADTATEKCVNRAINLVNTLELALGLPRERVIIVPGNHDERWKGVSSGSAGARPEALSWSNMWSEDTVVKPDAAAPECVFVCFNTSLDEATAARGSVAERDLARVSTQLRGRGRGDRSGSAIDSVPAVAVIHHHPNPWDEKTVALSTWRRAGHRILHPIRTGLDWTQELANASVFREFCDTYDIDVVLHGHKHKGRVREAERDANGLLARVAAVSCGTSLGKDDKPLTFMRLTLARDRHCWVVEWFEADRIGGLRRQPTRQLPAYIQYTPRLPRSA